MIQDSNAPSEMQPWVRQTEQEINALKNTIEKISSQVQGPSSGTNIQRNSGINDTFIFIPQEDGTTVTQARAIDFIGEITSSASIESDTSISVGERVEIVEQEGIQTVLDTAPYFRATSGTYDINSITQKGFYTPGKLDVNDMSLNVNGYGQISGQGLQVNLYNNEFGGYRAQVLDVTSGFIYRQDTDWVEGDPEQEIPVTVYNVTLNEVNEALFAAGTYIDVDGIDPIEFNLTNALIVEVEVDEVGFILSLKIEQDKSAFTYVDGGQVSLNSPSLKYESAVSVNGPGAENDYQGSRLSQNGLFVGPNGGSENEATSSLDSDGLITPIVNAKDKLVINQNGFYVQADEPASPSDGDLWINPEAASQVWDVANRVTDVASEAAAIAADVSLRPVSHNYVLNSAFDIWQRGATFTYGATAYTADRWRAGRIGSVAGGSTTRSTTVPTGFDYSISLQRVSGNTATNGLILSQPFESAGKNLRGKTVTLSFWALRGANYSATSNLLEFGFDSSSETPTAVGYTTGGLFAPDSDDRVIQTVSVALTTSWQRFSGTFTIPITTDAFQIWFRHNPTGTAGTNDFVRIAGVQLEEGLFMTPFKKNSGNIQAELAACQRYYYRISPAVSGNIYGTGYGATAASVRAVTQFPVPMRIAPTALETSGVATDYSVLTGSTVTTCNGVPTYISTTGNLLAVINFALSSGISVGSYYFARAVNANAHLAWSAEL